MIKSFFSLVVTSGILISCNNQSTNNSAVPQTTNTEQPAKDNQANHCYAYTTDKDSVLMEITTSGNSVSGTLTYKILEKDQNRGTIRGTMNGDTLIAAYKFMSEGIESVREVAFIKKGNDFIEGFGEVEEVNGAMKFKDISRINYSSNMVLRRVECGL